MKEIEEDMKKWKGIPCSWIRGIIIARKLMLSKAIYRFSAVTIKIPVIFHKSRKNY